MIFLEKIFISPIHFFILKLLNLFGDLAPVVFFITLFLKILLLPVSIKNFKYLQKIEKIQPEIKKIMENYKDPSKEKEKREKIMEVYQKEKINFFSPFVLLFVQILILVLVLKSFSRIEKQSSSLFILKIFPAFDPNPIFPVLLILFQVLNTPQRKQKIFSLVSGVLFLPILLKLPAAISFYFFSFQFLSFLERLVLLKLKIE